MLVYGDHFDEVDARQALDFVHLRFAAGDRLSALVEAGRLAQALVDEDEHRDPECMRFLLAIAQGAPPPPLRVERRPVKLRLPEGYAFYAVYPKLYAQAARSAPRRMQVIGIRSIGTSLAAVVAAACGGPVPITVRPRGHPFDRRVTLPRIDPRRHFAVVDEGPGLSGSSFISVAEALLEQGVPLSRIHLFPSHGNPPGSCASSGRSCASTLPSFSWTPRAACAPAAGSSCSWEDRCC
jgi:hypothetical protein